MKEYKQPEMEVIAIDVDVITDSCGTELPEQEDDEE